MSSQWMRDIGMHRDSSPEQIASRAKLVGIVDNIKPVETFEPTKRWWHQKLIDPIVNMAKKAFGWLAWMKYAGPVEAASHDVGSAKEGVRTLVTGARTESALHDIGSDAFGPDFDSKTAEYPHVSRDMQKPKTPHQR